MVEAEEDAEEVEDACRLGTMAFIASMDAADGDKRFKLELELLGDGALLERC